MGKKVALTPGTIDALREGKLDDPQTPGLSIEILPSGKRRWQYRRRIPSTQSVLKSSLGLFPAYSIADAREWARELNRKVEVGVDPRAEERERDRRAEMTVKRAHDLYMQAVREGRASRAKRKNKPRTVADKQALYDRDIDPALGALNVYDVSENDLVNIVENKGKISVVRANRLAAELKVFFHWASSLRSKEVSLPSRVP